MSVHADGLFPRKKVQWKTKERDTFFIEHREVDHVILAHQLKLNPRFVLSYLQRMGLRPMAGNPPAKILWGTNRRKRDAA